MTHSIETEPRSSGGSTSHYRWVVTGLIFLITIINYLDRSAISYAIGPIKKEDVVAVHRDVA